MLKLFNSLVWPFLWVQSAATCHCNFVIDLKRLEPKPMVYGIRKTFLKTTCLFQDSIFLTAAEENRILYCE